MVHYHGDHGNCHTDAATAMACSIITSVLIIDIIDILTLSDTMDIISQWAIAPDSIDDPIETFPLVLSSRLCSRVQYATGRHMASTWHVVTI